MQLKIPGVLIALAIVPEIPKKPFVIVHMAVVAARAPAPFIPEAVPVIVANSPHGILNKFAIVIGMELIIIPIPAPVPVVVHVVSEGAFIVVINVTAALVTVLVAVGATVQQAPGFIIASAVATCPVASLLTVTESVTVPVKAGVALTKMPPLPSIAN